MSADQTQGSHVDDGRRMLFILSLAFLLALVVEWRLLGRQICWYEVAHTNPHITILLILIGQINNFKNMIFQIKLPHLFCAHLFFFNSFLHASFLAIFLNTPHF